MPRTPSINLPVVDQVGSLIRPVQLQEAFVRHAAGDIDDAQLREAQDSAIRDVVDHQSRLDLPIVTDGEFRRRVFMNSFAEVSGWTVWSGATAQQPALTPSGPASTTATRTHSDPTRSRKYTITERLHLVRNAPLDEYLFTSKLTPRPVKITVIDTDRIRSVVDLEASGGAYHDMQDLLGDVVAIERDIVRGLAEAGCLHVQIDGPSYTRFVDAEWLAEMRTAGQDPMVVLRESIQADNAVIAGVEGVSFGMHLCRGNPSDAGYHRQGFYDPIAEPLFNELEHDRFLLEYDTERAGSFQPLRFVPKDRTVVLGLVSSKVPEAESVEDLKRRIDEAARYISLDQVAISPQCGFSSSLGGYPLTQDQQWRKFEVLLETARQVWG